MNVPRIVFATACLSLLITGTGLGQSNWTGLGGTNNWSETENWTALPSSGQDTELGFGSSANLNPFNDFSGFQLNRMVLTDGFSISGNQFEFVQNSITTLPSVDYSGGGTASVSNNWILTHSLSYNSFSNGILNYSGAMTGAGNFVINGAFTLGSSGQINNTGAVNTIGGLLTVDGTIAAGGTFSMSQNTGLNGTGVINRDVVLNGIAINSSGTLTVNGALDLQPTASYLQSGNLSVSGLTTTNNSGLIMSTGTEFSGAGGVVVNNGGILSVDGIVAASKNIMVENFGTLNGNGGVISGAVSVQGGYLQNNLTFENSVTFEADPVPSSVGNGGSNLTFNSAVNINNGAIVRFQGPSFGGTGAITVESGGTAIMLGTNVGNVTTVRGTMNSTSGGAIFQSDFYLDGGLVEGGQTDIKGNLTTTGNALLTTGPYAVAQYKVVRETRVQSGTFSVGTGVLLSGDAILGNGDLIVDQGASLANSGQIDKRIVMKGTLDGGSGSIISGAVVAEGADFLGSTTINNSLDVRTAATTTLAAETVVAVTGMTAIDQAIMDVKMTSTLDARGGLAVMNGGRLNANGNVIGNTLIQAGAFLTGNGMVQDVINNGTIAPGNSAGTLEVEGAVDLGSTSTVCIEIGGTMAGTQYDQLKGTSGLANATLNGALMVQLTGGFNPSSTDEFFVLQDLNISGIFSSGGFATGGSGFNYNIAYGANFVRLYSFQSAVPEPGAGLLLSLIIVAVCGQYRNRRTKS